GNFQASAERTRWMRPGSFDMAHGSIGKAQRDECMVARWDVGKGQPACKDALNFATAPAQKIDVVDADIKDHATTQGKIGIDIAAGGAELAREVAPAHGTCYTW